MGSFIRSEEMSLYQLFIQSEAAYASVSELGELGLVQFRNLNPDVNSFQQKFVNEVCRCDEMERKLRYFEEEIRKDNIAMVDTGENPEAPQPREMIDLEAKFEQIENELRDINQNAVALKRNYLELTELKHVLRNIQVFFDGQEHAGVNPTESMKRALVSDDNIAHHSAVGPVQLGFVAGVISRERLPAFERMLWRACKGNVFLRQAEIQSHLEDPLSGNSVFKSVFIIFFQGDQLKTRVMKICEGFRATSYPCPESASGRRQVAMEIMTRIQDLNTVLGETQGHRRRTLISAAKDIKIWFIKVRKIKAIYHTLNLFNVDVTQKCLIAEFWVPVLDIETIHLALRRGTDRSGSAVPPILNRMETLENPPTYNRTNKYTIAFQALIDTYGVASYREMNPALYTIITFPFLFAVMFGDAGHGLIIFLFGSWMLLKEKKLAAKKSNDEIWNMMFGGRYIIFLMGLFSVYTGIIYNDVFSLSMNFFGSSWKSHNEWHFNESGHASALDPKSSFQNYAYAMGIDPVWQVAQNKISFLNSYKMKISIIIGIIHMLLGIFVGLGNHFHFKRRLNIICEFLPQVIFLVSLFFYLTVLMIMKWFMYGAQFDDRHSPFCAPSILVTFINMFLMKKVEADKACETVYMYPFQDTFQKFLLLVALICVPWMLLAKPIILMRQRKSQVRSHEDVEDGVGAIQQTDGKKDDEEDIFEVFIHQGLHTIEYVLGCISHTASYLRLWALSLAHAQLSDVLWKMVLRMSLKREDAGLKSGFLIALGFGTWAIFTVAILILMEGLSAFLHTLRLHWVEFQSKFYSGLGYPFAPFSFKVILDSRENYTEE